MFMSLFLIGFLILAATAGGFHSWAPALGSMQVRKVRGPLLDTL